MGTSAPPAGSILDAGSIDEHRVVPEVLRQLKHDQPLLAERMERAWATCVDAVGSLVATIAAAARFDCHELVADQVIWLEIVLAKRGLERECSRALVESTAHVLRSVTDVPPAVVDCLERTGAQESFFSNGAEPVDPIPLVLGDTATEFMDLVSRGESRSAGQFILDVVDGGMPLRDVYLEVFQPVLHEVGRLWQENLINVAQEHYITGAVQMTMSRLYPRLFAGDRKPLSLVAASIGGDLHEVGLRMVADFFEMDGWDTYYIGANVPLDSIVETVAEKRPQVLGVSLTMPANLATLEELIVAVRAADGCGETRVLVGGRPFNLAPGLFARLGADGCAGSAPEALRVVDRLLEVRAHHE